MRVKFGHSLENGGSLISFFGLPSSSPSHPTGFAVVLADKEKFMMGGSFSRFVVVPFDQLQTDPPDRKWGLS